MAFLSRHLIFCLRVRGEVGYAILTQIFSCGCLAWRGMISQPFLEHHLLLLTLRPVSPLFRVVQLPFRADSLLTALQPSPLLVVSFSLYRSPHHLPFWIKGSWEKWTIAPPNGMKLLVVLCPNSLRSFLGLFRAWLLEQVHWGLSGPSASFSFFFSRYR